MRPGFIQTGAHLLHENQIRYTRNTDDKTCLKSPVYFLGIVDEPLKYSPKSSDASIAERRCVPP